MSEEDVDREQAKEIPAEVWRSCDRQRSAFLRGEEVLADHKVEQPDDDNIVVMHKGHVCRFVKTPIGWDPVDEADFFRMVQSPFKRAFPKINFTDFLAENAEDIDFVVHPYFPVGSISSFYGVGVLEKRSTPSRWLFASLWGGL